jgi:cysteine desulfurase/selenocysteine lyase
MTTLLETRPLDLVADFPAIPDGWAYLDTAATAQKPQPVIDAITRAMARPTRPCIAACISARPT